MAIVEFIDAKPPGAKLSETPYREQRDDILRTVRDLCGWPRPTFPGSQPVSLSLRNLPQLARSSYVATEKTDGARNLLFAASGFIFLIDRKEEIYIVQCLLPKPSPFLDDKRFLDNASEKTEAGGGGGDGDGDGDMMDINSNSINQESASNSWGLPAEREVEPHQRVLLDGELVVDQVMENDKPVTKTRFLVYDGVSLGRQRDIRKLNLIQRLALVLQEVVRPRAALMKAKPELIEYEKATNNFLDIYLKDFFEIWDLPAINNFQQRLSHPSDGIIFTPVAAPYSPGTFPKLMKWKPPHLNTVDFAVEFLAAYNEKGEEVIGAVKLLVGHQGLRAFTGIWLAMEGSVWEKAKIKEMECPGSSFGQIWECYYEPEAVTLIPALVQEREKTMAKDEIDAWKTEARKRALSSKSGEANIKKRERVGSDASLQSLEDEFLGEEHSSVKRVETSKSSIDLKQKNLLSLYEKCCPCMEDKTTQSFYTFRNAEFVPGGWVLERVRFDKNTPNDERVVGKVKESIEDGITFEILLSAILDFQKARKPVGQMFAIVGDTHKKHGSMSLRETTTTTTAAVPAGDIQEKVVVTPPNVVADTLLVTTLPKTDSTIITTHQAPSKEKPPKKTLEDDDLSDMEEDTDDI